MPGSPQIVYSANTYLGYKIAYRYYGDMHYVWVATAFGSKVDTSPLYSNPPTSLPLHRYRTMLNEAKAGDKHSGLISEQKLGLKKGAEEKFKQGVITEDTRDEILEVVDESETHDFMPLLYLSQYDVVKPLMKPVPIASKAHPMSQEYVIPELPGDKFDIIDISELCP